MKTLTRINSNSLRFHSGDTGRNSPFVITALGGMLATLLLLPPSIGRAGGIVTGRAGGIVTNCTEADLRAAMAGGGTVTFACDGTIALANTITNAVNTVLDATGRQVTVSGGNTVRVFEVETNVNLTLINLTVANGHSSSEGGGIYSAGNLSITNCTFVNCQAAPSGGAIYNAGVLYESGCQFMQNLAIGEQGATGMNGSTWISPGAGGSGGSGYGGAIYNAGAAVIERTSFTSNSASGGRGGNGGFGTSVYSSNAAPQWGGPGGNGGNGEGAAFFNTGTAALLNCTFAGNAPTGGTGGSGGNGGWIHVQGHHDQYMGGNGGNGGSARGTIRDLTGLVCLTNCTMALNSGASGTGGIGGSPGGQFGTTGNAWSGLDGSGSSLLNALLYANSPGGNCHGTFLDLSHNLSSDNSANFTNTGSLNNTDPKIGPLANNGGPTLTMALLSNSPAIDAGDTAAAPPTDQRGFPRAGLAADIGAFEYGSMLPVLSISPSVAGGMDIVVCGNTNKFFRLLMSTDLSNWVPVATNQFGSDGTCLYHDDSNPVSVCRFYRVVMP